MRTFALEEILIDQGHNSSAQRLILFTAFGLEDLEPDFKIRVANEKGRILLVTVAQTIQKPALVRVRVFRMETRVQALDKEPGETIVDPRAIVFAKEEPGLALRIPDDVLSAVTRAGEEQSPL